MAAGGVRAHGPGERFVQTVAQQVLARHNALDMAALIHLERGRRGFEGGHQIQQQGICALWFVNRDQQGRSVEARSLDLSEHSAPNQ